MLAADATVKAISLVIISSSGLRSPSCSISNSGLDSPPRNSSSHRSSSGSHSSNSSSDHQDTLAGRDHRVFVSVAASPNISMQNVELYLPAPLNTCPPAPYITPQGGQQANYSATSPGDYASSSGRTWTPTAHAAGPAWTARTFRLVLELLNRQGCDDQVLGPRRVCVFE